MTQTHVKRHKSEQITPGEYMMTVSDFRQIADTLNGETGIYLSNEKAPLVYSRLAKRLRALKLNSFSDYCNLITSKSGAEERRNMMNSLTTNVTRFFREPHHFDTMKTDILPDLIKQAKRGEKVRIWSAACSSGEEPYSIALTLLSMFPDAASHDVKILATDIDGSILTKAAAGVYRSGDVTIPSEAQKKKYFSKVDATGASLVASEELKQLITFRPLNLIKPWPLSGSFDIIFCRNVVIYFQESTQRELWAAFHKALKPNSWLFIGHSERITGPVEQKFKSEGLTAYRRVE